jgi:hypothetical protein
MHNAKWGKRMKKWKSPCYLAKVLANYKSKKAIQAIQRKSLMSTHSYRGRKYTKLRKHN